MSGIARRTFLAIALTAALCLAALNPTASAHAPAPGLAHVSEVRLSPRLREVTLQTPLLATQSRGVIPANPTGETKVRILLPAGYDPKGTQRYPVLYLFHGGGSNHTDWTTPAGKGRAEELTKDLPLIIVMPEGGIAGGYADWYNDGAFGPPQWKTYHLDQLLPWIDANFRTIANRGGRATAGLSMGGGGLRYAAQRPDLIGATAAFSGDIDILQPASDWNGAGAMISKMIWGDRKDQEVLWRGVNGVDLAKNLANTDVAIFTGDTGRPEGTYILQGSTAVHEALNGFGIAHQFVVYPGMTHSWPNWNKALAAWLPHLMSRFHAFNPRNSLLDKWSAPPDSGPTANPTAFSYSTIEPSYSLYGWSVQMDRKAVEFSALEVVDPWNFTVIGSGNALVHTAVVGKPNESVRVAITHRNSPEPGRAVTLRTDSEGRLAVPVELGPPNPFQQFSPEANSAATGAPTDETPFPLNNNGSRFYRADVRVIAGAS